ncbi:hypothetical protein OPQ81_006942 [Rhizoctonia solani]|nr:hypothetical protein OPQ81_006942 [Rhizoctonia solani]
MKYEPVQRAGPPKSPQIQIFQRHSPDCLASLTVDRYGQGELYQDYQKVKGDPAFAPRAWTIYCGTIVAADAIFKAQVFTRTSSATQKKNNKGSSMNFPGLSCKMLKERFKAFQMIRLEAEKKYSGKIEFLVRIYEIQVSEGHRGTAICFQAFNTLENIP